MTRPIDRVHEHHREAAPPRWEAQRTLLGAAVSQVERLHAALGLPIGISLVFDAAGPRIEVPADAPAAAEARALAVGAANGVPVTVAVIDVADGATIEHKPSVDQA